MKYRSNNEYGYAIQSVNKKKQAKIKKAAQWFLTEKGINDCSCSFDIIAIQGKHIKYVFNSYGAI